MPNIHVLLIDCQRDFCSKDGALFVPGATEDMDRLALFLKNHAHRFSDIHVTQDSHQPVDIAHPIWFVSADDGTHPPPFTTMKIEGTGPDAKIMGHHMPPPLGDGRVVRYRTRMRAMERGGTGNAMLDGPTGHGTLGYINALEAGGRYPHMIWPVHCVIGSEGHALMPDVFDALMGWTNRFGLIDFVAKGSNPWTEHFSAVQAEVPFPGDPTTQLNRRLIDAVEQADVLLVAGEALTHCDANTMMDIIGNFNDPAAASKVHLLADAMSPVPGCDALAANFKAFCAQHKVNWTTTTTFFA